MFSEELDELTSTEIPLEDSCLEDTYQTYLDPEYIQWYIKCIQTGVPLVANVEDLYDGRYEFQTLITKAEAYEN